MPTNGEPVHPATVSAEGISYPDRLLAAYLDAVAALTPAGYDASQSERDTAGRSWTASTRKG